MVSPITRLVGSVSEWFRNDAGEDARDGAGKGPAATQRRGDGTTREASLFQCPDCEAVYVATDKDTCSTCGAAVDQVPSTLADTA